MPVEVLNSSYTREIGAAPIWPTFLTCVLWHRVYSLSPKSVFLSTGGTQISYVLIVSGLLSVLLGAVATAAGGALTFIQIGGITSSQQNAPAGSDSNHRIDKPQTGLGNLSIPDTTKPTGGGGPPVGAAGHSSLVDKSQTGGGGTTLPLSNSGIFHTGSTTSGPPANQFCSSSDVTIGESHQLRLHCPNTVGGTIRQ